MFDILSFWNIENEVDIKIHPILKHFIKSNIWNSLFEINKQFNLLFTFNDELLKYLKLIKNKKWTNGDKAVKYEYLYLIKHNDLIYTKKAFLECAKNGNIEIMKFLFEKNIDYHIDTFDICVKYDNFNLVLYLHSKNVCYTNKSLEYACENQNDEITKWLVYNKKPVWSFHVFEILAENGNLNLLKFLFENTNIWFNEYTMIIACQKKNMNIIEFLNNKTLDINYDNKLIDIAIYNNDEILLNFLLKNRKEKINENNFLKISNNKKFM